MPQRPTSRPRPRRGALAVLVVVVTTVGGVVSASPAAAAATTAAAAARPAPGRPLPSGLSAGQRLPAGSWLASPDRFVTLHMQRDGNLTLLSGGHLMWSSRTRGTGNYLMMTASGDVGVFSRTRRQLWATHTRGAANRWLVQDDGNITVRGASGRLVWQLGTAAVELDAGHVLAAGQFLTGRGRESLHMQGDGNLVLRRGTTPIWDAGTQRHPGAFVQLQRDGNLVVYARNHRVLWSTGGAGPAGRLSIGPDGDLSLHRADGRVVWHTHTPRTTTAAAVARQLLAMWGGRVTGLPDAYHDLQAASRGQTIRNSGSCGRSVRLDVTLLQFLVRVTDRYRIKVNYLVTGHRCDALQHPKGRAVDMGGAWDLRTGTATSFGGFWGPDRPSLDRAFVSYASTILPAGAGLGQSRCPGRSTARIRAGVRFFADSCTHQHIEVRPTG